MAPSSAKGIAGRRQAQREQGENGPRAAEHVGDAHDAAHRLRGDRRGDEEETGEPAREPVTRPARDEEHDQSAIEAVEEHVDVVVRKGALLAAADLPQGAPDDVR